MVDTAVAVGNALREPRSPRGRHAGRAVSAPGLLTSIGSCTKWGLDLNPVAPGSGG